MTPETATISNGPPSQTAPTAPLSPPFRIVIIDGASIAFAGASFRDQPTVEILYTPPPRRELLELKAVRLWVDTSNKGGGCSRGLPSYTEARFAPPSWPRVPASAPRAAPTPARARCGREALRRKKRSRDFARTGRRRPPTVAG